MNAVVDIASAGIFRWDLMGVGWQAGLGQANWNVPMVEFSVDGPVDVHPEKREDVL